MKISVLMSAYNGAKFIKEQLDTIVNQSQKPYELILVDDCSTDNNKTYNIFKEYKQKYDFIKIFQNPKNYGYEKSFFEGLKYVTGEVVMFADDDDIWDLEKIKIINNYFEKEKTCGILHAINYKIEVDDKKSALSFKMQNNIKYSNKLIKDKFVFDKHFILTKGEACGLSIKMDFINKYKNLWIDAYAHDDFWEALLIMFDKLYYLESPLVTRRIHGQNETALKSKDSTKILRYLKIRKQLCENILNSGFIDELDDTKILILKKYLEYSDARINALEKSSIKNWLSIANKDLSFYNKKAAWLRDLVWIIK